MARFDREVGALLAMAQVRNGFSVPFAVAANRGFASVQQTSIGVYDLVFEAGMTGADQDVTQLTVATCAAEVGDAPGVFTREWLDARTLRLRAFDAGILFHSGFDVKVYRATNHEPA